MGIVVLDRSELAETEFSHELMGADHGGLPVSLILVDAGPGEGPSLHEHDYAELFVVLEGEATFTDGREERTVRAGQIAIVPGGQPHGFVNPGPGRLRQIDIHLSERFRTTWL